MATEEDKEEKQANACCQKLKEELLKAESGRKNLRKAINILENAVRKAQEEIATLKKECENKQIRAEDESRSAQEEKRQRQELEKEHSLLKTEFASVLQRLNDFESKSKIEKGGKSEKAIVDEKIVQELEKEHQALAFEKKHLEEMRKQANAEKRKAEEAKKHAEIARKKADEEKKCAGIERKKFEEEKKRADAERKRADDEKISREMLEKKLQQLELERQRAEEGRRHYEAKEYAPALLENTDKKTKGEIFFKELSKKEQQQLKVERKRAEEQKKQIELLKQEHSLLKEQLEKEQKCLKMEMEGVEEEKRQRQTFERECFVLKEKLEAALAQNADRKKSYGDKVLKELLKKEQQVLKAEKKRAGEHEKQVESLKKEHILLKEELEKAERKRAEEEKRQREALERECSILKERLAWVIQHLKSQGGQLNDTQRELQQLQMEVYAVDGSSICKRSLAPSQTLAKARVLKSHRSATLLIENEIQGNSVFNNSVATCHDAGLSVSGGSFTEPIPGIGCVLEPSVGGSVEKPVQSSAFHSSVTSFSDRQLVESQGRGACNASNSSKVRKHKKKRELVVPQESLATSERVSPKMLALLEGPGVNENMMDRNEKRSLIGRQGNVLSKPKKCTGVTTIHKETNGAVKKQRVSGRKRKNEPESLTDSLMDLFHKEKKMHVMIEGKLESLRKALKAKKDISVDVPSTKLKGNKQTGKRKRNTPGNSSCKEDMQFKDKKIDEYKADYNMKEDCSGNCSQIHMPHQENEQQEGESHDKEQANVKGVREFIGSGTSHDGLGKTTVEGAGSLLEMASNKQVNAMGMESKIGFDITKLLQLDIESEEELYIQIKECPLSPTLPEIPSPCLEELDDNKFDPILGKASFKSFELQTTRDSCADVTEDMNSIPSQGYGARKAIELRKGINEEFYFQAKENLSSISQLEEPFGVRKQVEVHCMNFFREDASSQFDSSFITGNCGNGVCQENRIITNKKYLAETGILNNNLSVDVIEEDNLGNINENRQHELCRVEIEDYHVEPESSHHHARDVGDNEKIEKKGINDLLSGSWSRNSDTVDFKSTKSFNKYIELISRENFEELCTGSLPEKAEVLTEKYGNMSSDSIQAGHENHAELRGICETSVTEEGVLYSCHVGQGNTEQVDEFGIKAADRRERSLIESGQEQIKASKICGHEQRCFSVFLIQPSSCEQENASYILFKSITSYLEIISGGSLGEPDLEQFILTFDSVTMLSQEENVCICISALVSNLASLQLESEGRTSCKPDEASFLWIKDLIDQINKVSSNHATKGAFSKVFVIDILVSLMTKFLIEGEVMVCTVLADGKHGFSHFNGKLVEAEHRRFSVLRRVATLAELEAGSLVLAAFCLAFGNVDCLYDIMYKVLRWCKKDSMWLHTVVHSIIFLCWKYSIQVSRSNLLGNALCTIILLLEGHEKGAPQSLLNNSVITSVKKQMHPLSMHCPFAEDVLSMDAIISSLLDTLYRFPDSGYLYEQTPPKISACENSALIDYAEREEGSQRMNYCQQDGSAALSNIKHISKQGDQYQNQAGEFPSYICSLHDAGLALELVAQYLGWDWTYNELIPHFWRIAQPNAPEVLVVTIFLLVGSIGRFGIDYDGSEQYGVEELRCNFSTFLDMHCMSKSRQTFSFSCQLAAAQSLFELIAGNIKVAAANQIEPPERIVDRETAHSYHLKILKKWYSKLSAEKESMLPELMRAYISPLTS